MWFVPASTYDWMVSSPGAVLHPRYVEEQSVPVKGRGLNTATTVTDHITNEEAKTSIGNTVGPYEDLTSVKKRQMKWHGHVTRSSGLAKTVLQGTVQGGRRRGRQRKRWEDNVKEWTGLEWNSILRKAENREEWRKLVVESTVVPQRSARLRDRRLLLLARISVDLPWLSFSSQPCHPSLPASSLWGSRCLRPTDQQMCQPVLRRSFCHASVPTKPNRQQLHFYSSSNDTEPKAPLSNCGRDPR